MTILHKGFKYRLYPTKEQAQILSMNMGIARATFNYLKYSADVWYKENAEEITQAKEFGAEAPKYKKPKVVDIKAAMPFISNGDSRAVSAAMQNFDAAVKKVASDNKRRRPDEDPHHTNYKLRSGRQSYSSTRNPGSLAINLIPDEKKANRAWLKLPKIKSLIEVRYHRPLPEGAAYSTVNISREASGKYYVSFAVAYEQEPLESTGKDVGIDIGEIDIATLSDGTKFGNRMDDLRKLDDKIAAINVKIDRQRASAKSRGVALKDCKNYHKTLCKRATLYEKKRNIIANFQANIASKIVKNNDNIYIEDLDIASMLKNKKAIKI